MLELLEVKGSGGGGGGGDQPEQPVNTPDNLFTEDVVEFALAISEGPIRGLAKGAKSFYVGDTPLVSESGNLNFQKFAIGVHPGYPDGVAKKLELVLGGETSNYGVGVNLNQGVSVTRQTDSSLRNKIDEIEVRVVIGRLMRATQSGTFNNTAQFMIDYKQASSLTWTPLSSVSDYVTVNAEAQWVPGIGGALAKLIYLTDGANVPSQYIPENSYEWNGESVTTVKRDVPIASEILNVTGKTSSGVVKEYKIQVPRINEDWMIRVTKLNPDASTEEICDISWESFQCTTKEPKAYPDTAIVHGVGVATGQFSSIPTFSGIWDGKLIRVPTNYNPDARTYDDATPWDGSFKFAWSNNPAWVLYDLIVNTKYGLAAHYPYVDANRFDFYEAARWCDEMVPSLNNPSVLEPRFTYNDVIAEPRDAKEMLSYVAGSFNAIVWDDLSGKIHLRVDRDDPAIKLFAPENVTEAGFNYTFTDASTRVNDISVAFINPDMDWNEDRRRIPNVTTDEAAIQREGRIPYDFIAVGCTNISEAVRKARYRLLSAQTETMMVNFTTTRLGADLTLFDVILVADPIMGWSQSGRITHYDTEYMYLRDPIYVEQLIDFTVKFQTPLGIVEKLVTAEQLGDTYRFRFVEPLTSYLPKNATFNLEQADNLGFAKPFRVMSVQETDGSPYLFQVSAIELNRQKYSAVETGEPVPEVDYTPQADGVVSAPNTVVLKSGQEQIEIAPNGHINYRISASWTAPRGSLIDRFEASWSNVDDSVWTDIVPTSSTSFYINNVIPGQVYVARVRSVDPFGNRSAWTYSVNHLVLGVQTNPDPVTSFTATGGLFQNTLKWSFNNFPTIKAVEIWVNSSNDQGTSTYLTEVPYPANTFVHNNLGVAQAYFYWARVRDRDGNYSSWSAVASAMTESDPTLLLDILQNSIGETQLMEDLRSEIALISADASVPGSVSARIQTTVEEAITGPGAIAEQVTTLQTTVNGHTSSLQTQGSSIDGLSAKYVVKIDNNGYISGFGLASTANNGVPTSAFIVNADSFAVGKPGSTNKYPFTIGMIGGISTVGIDGTLVVDGTIAASKIDTRGLTIKDTSGNVVFASGQTFLTSENASTYIASGAIGNAQIGNVIQSTNYVANTSGWKIDKSGTAEFRNIIARGDIQATSLNAATGTFSGTLTATAVDAIDTINLRGQAVTTSVYASGNSISVTVPSGAVVLVIPIIYGNYAFANANSLTYIYRNGVVVRQMHLPIAWADGFSTQLADGTTPFLDTPGAGTHTYSISTASSGSCSFEWSIFIYKR